jgi:uncharacterized membrane protein
VPHCPSCNQEIAEAARFCTHCGAAIGWDDEGGEAAPPATPKLVSGIAENIAGLLCYFVLPAAVFLLLHPFKRNRFVRFHCYQCLITVGVLIIVHFGLILLARALPLVALPLLGLVMLAEFTVWLLLLVKSYQGEMFKLPLVGDVAAQLAGRA